VKAASTGFANLPGFIKLKSLALYLFNLPRVPNLVKWHKMEWHILHIPKGAWNNSNHASSHAQIGIFAKRTQV
jgi:hypothetical protein